LKFAELSIRNDAGLPGSYILATNTHITLVRYKSCNASTGASTTITSNGIPLPNRSYMKNPSPNTRLEDALPDAT
jgi:hypothetical protein